MFTNVSHLLRDNPPQLNYGAAVCDVDRDGACEFFVAGYGFRNLVLKWDGTAYHDVAPPLLADATRRAIGVAAGDLDGDGREEIYVLNTDTFAGEKAFGDRLFDCRDGQWMDLFGLPENMAALNLTAGRSVAWIDRLGTGRYGCVVANYGGPMRLYEMGAGRRLADVAARAGIATVAGGRSLLTVPIVGDKPDIFAGNENGPNFLYHPRGDGTYEELARTLGLHDAMQHARGVAVADVDGDGRPDIICGNWEGPHRVCLQTADGRFVDAAPPFLAAPSRVRTVLVADFDNDGHEEIFFNNMGEANRLGRHGQLGWEKLPLGAALESTGLGTGATVADLDGDGMLELLVCHGEAAAQPLTLYKVPANGNGYLRVAPLTRFGAPARGAVVTLRAGERRMWRAICGGSGYLCQMEPVAHFGLGGLDAVDEVNIRWPDGATATLHQPALRTTHTVAHPTAGR